VKHFVDPVHLGTDGLPLGFTGKDVIVGVIDAGLDINHPDFIDQNGNSRVLYYWDQTMPDTGGYVVPQPFDYGLEFSNSQIQNGSLDGLTFISAHGTNSTGIVAGNGLANGKNKGMAPDSKIIFVNYTNYSMAFADACEYIFQKADEVGLPCVINISVGFYLGSHDGNDPATEYVEDLLDEKPGRIVTVAGGNSGAFAPYHVRANVNSSESFVWFENNPNQSLYTGTQNTVIFDLWADSSQIANVEFAIGANHSSGSYSERGTTIFRTYNQNLNDIIYDTLRNVNGEKMAFIEIYPTLINGLFNYQALIWSIDSTSYYYSLKTRGSGSYDLWSSAAAGINLNNIVSNIPSSDVYPPIVNYHAPDLEQSIVSGLACSEKIIAVGNILNRHSYTSLSGNVITNPNPPMSLSSFSSKGPTRKNLIKPDVVATGNFSFAAATLAYLANPANSNLIEEGGFHSRASGSSASSPVVCGISALYLERCSKASYQDFIEDLHASAYSSQFSGSLPNNSFGYGYAHALETILRKNYTVEIIGNQQLCSSQDSLTVFSTAILDSVIWEFNGEKTNTLSLNISSSGDYYSFTYDQKACVETDTLTVTLGTILAAPVISNNGGVLTASLSPNYQWYQNGNLLNGQTFQTFVGNFNPNAAYTVSTSSNDGCIVFSEPYGINSLDEISKKIKIFPNPSSNFIEISDMDNISKISITDINGKSVYETTENKTVINISKLNKGIYFIKIETEKEIIFTKFERL
jgi:hypothetical protein